MEKRNCNVCGTVFSSEDGLVSCEAHSFGEREAEYLQKVLSNNISVGGFKAHLNDVFTADNPEMLDDELPEAFNDYLSNSDKEDLWLEAKRYCKSMGVLDNFSAIVLYDMFMKDTFGK